MRGSPYNLVVSMMKKVESSCIVHLEGLRLVDAENQTIPFSAPQLDKSFDLKYAGKYHASFVFHDVNLVYDDYVVEIQFSIDGGSGCDQTEKTRIPIKRNYKQYKIGGIWSQ